MRIVLELILGTSIVLQLCAAVLALWLIRTTGRRFTWIAIAAAILLMVARRLIALVHLPTGHNIHPPDLANEAVGLVISILMLAGVATIGPLFAAIQKSRRELLQSQQTLCQSEERFRELAELAPQAIVETDTEGRLRWVNQKAIEYSGYSEAELLDGLRLTDQVLPEDQARIEDHMNRILLGQQPGPVEYAARRKDGSTYPVEAHGSPILHDGHVAGLKAVVIDVTERKLTCQQIDRLARERQMILDSSSELIIFHDLDQKIRWANSAACQAIGMDIEALMGQFCYSAFHRLAHVPDECPVRKALDTARAHEGRVTWPNGKVWWIRAFPTFDADGRLFGVTEFASEITERIRQQNELERARRLETAGQVAGQAAHDFNNLLGPLIAYPEMARRHLHADSPVHRMLDTIQSSATQMADISQDLLTLSRRSHYKIVPLDLNQAIEETLQTIAMPAGVTVDKQLDPDLLPCKGGKAQLQRVFLNLLSNARDAVGTTGCITIATDSVYLDTPLTRYALVKKGEFVRARITDNGSGIPPEIIDRIFDPFFTTKTVDKHHGTGLGLSVVHSVMEDHKGYVDIESAPGSGTTIDLYFTVCRDEIRQEENPSELPRGSGQRVLVVDDDPIQRQVVGDALTELGYNISTATSGEEAVQMGHEATYDILVLDVVMDGIDGVETLRRIKETHPNQIALLMSGYARNDRVEEAMTLGARESLAKPVRTPTLAVAIHRALLEAAPVGDPSGEKPVDQVIR